MSLRDDIGHTYLPHRAVARPATRHLLLALLCLAFLPRSSNTSLHSSDAADTTRDRRAQAQVGAHHHTASAGLGGSPLEPGVAGDPDTRVITIDYGDGGKRVLRRKVRDRVVC